MKLVPFSLKGAVSLPGDKSISHRALILSALFFGPTRIKNFPLNDDCMRTVDILRKLGVRITINKKGSTALVKVSGVGLNGLKRPVDKLFAGDSGTTMRLILGLLAGQDFKATVTAGKSLAERPMQRVIEPLKLMGAMIASKGGDITIRGGNLKPILYKLPVASAQVKSAILLAGLYAKGTTTIIEPQKTRDHTERMLKSFKANVRVKDNRISVAGCPRLISPGEIFIPADISTAAFFMVAAAIIPGSKIILRNVSLNHGRIGVLKALKRMGADIKVTTSPRHHVTRVEPAGDIIVRSSKLKGIIIKREEIPSLIDEIPILMVAACFAKGKTIFKGAGELRVKETDRIKSMAEGLNRMGGKVSISGTAKSTKITVSGVNKLEGARVKSFGDHRTAMSLIVAGLAAQGTIRVDNLSCISKSFPGFLNTLESTLDPLVKRIFF